MQRNQPRGSGGYNDWTNQHRDMTPPRGSGLPQQGRTHPMAAGSGVPLLATPQIPPQASAHLIGGNRSLMGMMPVYNSPLVSSATSLQSHPQAQGGVVLHAGGSGIIPSNSSKVGSIRGGVQQGAQKSMLPSHGSAASAVKVGSSSSQTHPPPPVPPQLDIWDLACGTVSLADVAPSIWRLGVSGSAIFILKKVESFLKSRVEIGKKDLIQEKLKQLVNIFIFHQSFDSVGPPPDSQGAPCSSMEELKLIVAMHNKLEEQTDAGLRYGLFDAIFGGIVEEHSQGSVGVAGYLFQEFCELLPDASAPLSQLASHSPHLAYQLTSAVTFLYPFHLLGNQPHGVDPLNLQPSLCILAIISDWVETSPDFLYATSKHFETTRSKFPLLHSTSTTQQSSLLLPITGIIQWCILSPLVKCRAKKSNGNTSTMINTEAHCQYQTASIIDSTKLPSPDDHASYQEKVARLHANLLSALLSSNHTTSSSSPSTFSSLSSDDVAILVANLLAFSQKQGLMVGGGESKKPKGGASAGSKIVVKQEADEGMSVSHILEQSVERFAQFLQISLSTEVLQLKPEDLTYIASTLPKNRLLEVVITHCTQQLKSSQQANHKGHSK